MLFPIGLKLGFWNFKPTFLRMQLSLVATFFWFSLSVWVEICILNFLISFQHLHHSTFGDKSVRIWDFHTSYLTLWKPNGLSKHLKDHLVIGLDLSASAELAVKRIILKCYYVVDLILDSIWIVLVFYCKVCAFRIIIFLYCICLVLFYLRINKPNIHNNVIDIPSSKNGLLLLNWFLF